MTTNKFDITIFLVWAFCNEIVTSAIGIRLYSDHAPVIGVWMKSNGTLTYQQEKLEMFVKYNNNSYSSDHLDQYKMDNFFTLFTPSLLKMEHQ